MKITILLENTACDTQLLCEHGLSLYVETGGRRLLFDMGQTGAFADNAAKLGADLSRVDLAVLSHGHYDHGGGLPRFLQENTSAKVYVNRHAFEPHYNGAGNYIGLPVDLAQNPRIVMVQDTLSLGGGLSLHTLPLPPADSAGLMTFQDGVRVPEDFRHEQYLLAEEEGRRILLSGCSHKGILQIVEHFRPDVLVGGFHFIQIEEESVLKRAAQRLLQYPLTYYTGHCTGEKQFAVLKSHMGDRLHALPTGAVVQI